MNARVAGVAGSALALVVVGGFAAASTFQSAPAPLRVVQPAVVETVAPVVVPTTAAPVVVAPVPVESTQAPVVVAPKLKVVTVPKAAAPAAPAPGLNAKGEVPAKDANGDAIPLPPPGGVTLGHSNPTPAP